VAAIAYVRETTPPLPYDPASVPGAVSGCHRGRFHSRRRYSIGTELIFEVRDSEDGGYCARALGPAIFTEAETWNELRANVLEAAALHFEDAAVRPRMVQLHYVKDELIPVEAA
jgi:predicted RNase H-like HicB family nuclease